MIMEEEKINVDILLFIVVVFRDFFVSDRTVALSSCHWQWNMERKPFQDVIIF
jgi:hypothetical protein